MLIFKLHAWENNMKKMLGKIKENWAVILFFVFIGFVFWHYLHIKNLLISLADLIVDLVNAPLWVTLFSVGSTILIFYIALNWNKRDDFFYFIASLLSCPSNYIYEKRKKQLLNYCNEIKELRKSIIYFTKIDEDTLSKEDFLKFIDTVSKQNERLEKNRTALEKQNDKINIFVQLFILCCGVITSLLF